MLFRKDMDPRCAYCQRGQQINEREVACVKRGGGAPLPGIQIRPLEAGAAPAGSAGD
mgnify:CR=1 FL=1